MPYVIKYTIALYLIRMGVVLSIVNFGLIAFTSFGNTNEITFMDFEDFDNEEKSKKESEKLEDEGEKEKITNAYAVLSFENLWQKYHFFNGVLSFALAVHLDPYTPPPEHV